MHVKATSHLIEEARWHQNFPNGMCLVPSASARICWEFAMLCLRSSPKILCLSEDQATITAPWLVQCMWCSAWLEPDVCVQVIQGKVYSLPASRNEKTELLDRGCKNASMPVQIDDITVALAGVNPSFLMVITPRSIDSDAALERIDNLPLFCCEISCASKWFAWQSSRLCCCLERPWHL